MDLINAVKSGDMEKVERLLDANPGLAASKEENGVSVILLALYYGYPDIAKRLAKDRNDLSIFEAAVLGKVDRIEEILRAIPEAINAISPDGFTALGFAAYFGQLEVTRTLLAHGANPNIVSKNSLGVAPLHSALAGGQSAIALLLLNSGADVNLQSAEGWTALHYTADIGDSEIAALILDVGANHSLKNVDGRTAAQLAADVGHDHVAEVILETVGVE